MIPKGKKPNAPRKRMYVVKNIGPALSIEEVAAKVTAYHMAYDFCGPDRDTNGSSVYNHVYGEALRALSENPMIVLQYFVSEVCQEYAGNPIDDMQMPMVSEIVDSIKAMMAARGF